MQIPLTFLDDLIYQPYIFLAVFMRLGTMMMVFPAFSESTVSVRIRLMIALTITFVMVPLVAGTYPPQPATVAGMFYLLGTEFVVGIFIAGAARLIMAALHTAGFTMGFQTSLAFAQNFDPTQGIQSALLATFLSILGITLIFVTDMHHLMIAAMRDSYTMFAPGAALPVGDFAAMVTATVAGTFKLAIQMSAPLIAFALIFNLSLGVLAKLMPQVQIFFVAIPANLLAGFLILAMTLSAVMIWFLEHVEQTIGLFTV